MCLIILRGKEGRMNLAAADSAAVTNSDGYGIAWHDGTSIQVEKNRAWEFIRARALILQDQELEFILHMRYATHGEVNDSNTHPFALHRHGSVMAHNGIIHTLETPEGMCDSRVLADHIDRNLPPDWHASPEPTGKVERLASTSRLAFMLADGQTVLVNEERGAWQDGCWYSQPGAISTRRRNWHDPSLWIVEEPDEAEPMEERELDTRSQRTATLFDYRYSGNGPSGLGTTGWSATQLHPDAPTSKK